MKISKNVFIILQYYIEQYIVQFLKESNAAAIHSGRVKLMVSDIQFICKLKGISIGDHKNDSGVQTKICDDEVTRENEVTYEEDEEEDNEDKEDEEDEEEEEDNEDEEDLIDEN